MQEARGRGLQAGRLLELLLQRLLQRRRMRLHAQPDRPAGVTATAAAAAAVEQYLVQVSEHRHYRCGAVGRRVRPRQVHAEAHAARTAVLVVGQLCPCGTRLQSWKERGEHVGVGGVQNPGDHVGAALQEGAVPLGVRRLEGDEERRVGHDWRVLLAVRVGDDPSLGLTSSSSDVCCLPGATFLTVFLLQLRARWWLHLRLDVPGRHTRQDGARG